MKRFYLAIAAAVIVAVGGPAGADVQGPVSGEVRVTVHTHSKGTLLFQPKRLPFNFGVGDTFAYSSRLCSGNAPFNDIGLNFTPNYPGVDDNAASAARVRHLAEGTIISKSGDRGVIEGKITTVLCLRDASGAWVASPNVLVSYYRASYTLVSPNNLRLEGVFRFSSDESTGTFADIQGSGRIEARLTCLATTSCAPLGEFHDFVSSTGDPSLPPGRLQPGMAGSFRDSTVGPIAR